MSMCLDRWWNTGFSINLMALWLSMLSTILNESNTSPYNCLNYNASLVASDTVTISGLNVVAAKINEPINSL